MICAVVLAAGLSRRMGVQKLLLPYGGSTMIAHVVDQVLESVVDGVYVVVARDRQAVAAALSPRPVELITNPQANSKMLDSVRCGIAALPADCEATLVVLGDQPGVTAALMDRMVDAYRTSGRAIVVPCHEGRRGHPLLCSTRFRAEILTRYDDAGLRGLLREHADQVCELEVSSSAVLCDVDYPEDYRRALARLGAGGQGE